MLFRPGSGAYRPWRRRCLRSAHLTGIWPPALTSPRQRRRLKRPARPRANTVMPAPELPFPAGTLAEAWVVVLVPVLVGGTCMQLCHDTFLLSHPTGWAPFLYGRYYFVAGLTAPHGGSPHAARSAVQSLPLHHVGGDGSMGGNKPWPPTVPRPGILPRYMLYPQLELRWRLGGRVDAKFRKQVCRQR